MNKGVFSSSWLHSLKNWSLRKSRRGSDRYDKGSLIITSQIPVDRWHDMIGIPTLADAILDRVIHNAYRIDLAGESLRKTRSSS
jgi:hypothetical protein